MCEKPFEILFLPLFEEDLLSITEYIAYKLQNPEAAEKLIDDVQTAIRERAKYPTTAEQFTSTHERKHPYYRIYIKNYTIFYVVIGNVMEVRRIIYSRSNIKEKI